MPKLVLRCVGCGKTYVPPALHCDLCDGLLRSEYAVTDFKPCEADSLFAFKDWLPPTGSMDTSVGPKVYRSERLSEWLGLNHLTIAFNGYAPAVGAMNPTGSFKDFEALPTILFKRELGIDSLILSSAGNTARAFAHAATQLDYPVVIIVPERAVPRLWLPCKPSDAVRLIVIEGNDDYAFAIRTAGMMSDLLGIAPEGGARNVARRDGMSTAILEYARRFGDLPMHYIQAIGSGTGAIAVWEGAQRLRGAGIGSSLPVLHLAQNAPFTPIHDAWTAGASIDPETDLAGQLNRIARIDALVLANRTPPYAIPGGVRDALKATRGQTYAVTNAEARDAAALFLNTEGLAIGPAAAVATAAMIQAIRAGKVTSNDPVLLHITGNNEHLIQRDVQLHNIDPVAVLRHDRISEATIKRLRQVLLP